MPWGQWANAQILSQKSLCCNVTTEVLSVLIWGKALTNSWLLGLHPLLHGHIPAGGKAATCSCCLLRITCLNKRRKCLGKNLWPIALKGKIKQIQRSKNVIICISSLLMLHLTPKLWFRCNYYYIIHNKIMKIIIKYYIIYTIKIMGL